MTRAITIYCGTRGTGLFHVHEGERYTGDLCWDEMLGEIAQLTHPEIGHTRYGMGTPEAHQEKEAHRREQMARRRAEEPAPGHAALEVVIREFGCRGGPDDALLPLHLQPTLVREAMQALRPIALSFTPETA